MRSEDLDAELVELLDDEGHEVESSSTRALIVTGLIAGGIVAVVVLAAMWLPGRSEPALSVDDFADQVAQGDANGSNTLADRLGPGEQAPLPQKTLQGFGDGPARAVRDYQGTPLILNFWASWCAPCVEEMPDLEELSKRAGSRLQVLGVNYDDNAEAAGALARELDITYDLAVDADKSLFREVEAFGMPTTLFVDEQGTIVFRRTGAMTAEEFRDAAREHLGVDV